MNASKKSLDYILDFAAGGIEGIGDILDELMDGTQSNYLEETDERISSGLVHGYRISKISLRIGIYSGAVASVYLLYSLSKN